MDRSRHFVLVHGAWEGGWAWQRVAAALRGAGCVVHAPTLTGCGERAHLVSRAVSLETHVADVVSLLVHEDVRDAVLVGHSYGGTVCTGVADREPGRLRQLVYLDASAPVDGQNATGAFSAASAVSLDREPAVGDSWLVPPLPYAVLGVVDGADMEWMEPRRHPHPLRTLEEPVRLTRTGAGVPRGYVRCTRRDGLVGAFGVDPLAPFVERARREAWAVRDIDAPHAAHIVAPDLVAEALLAAWS